MCDPLKDVPIYRVNDAGVTWVERVTFSDTDEATDYLARLALEDAPRLSSVVGRVTHGARSRIEALAMLHAWAQGHVAYVDDDACEEFAAPLAVLKKGGDDCDGMSTLMAALAVANGCVFALPNMNGTRQEPAHVSCWVADPAELPPRAPGRAGPTTNNLGEYGTGPYVFGVDAPIWAPLERYETPPGWYWAETTIAAKFGEHPADALRRLGPHARHDLTGG